MHPRRLILPAAFLQVISRWVSSFNEGSNVTPRYLYCIIQFMEVTPNLMSSCLSLNISSLFAVPKSIAFVFPFFRFMGSSFLQNQLASLLTCQAVACLVDWRCLALFGVVWHIG